MKIHICDKCKNYNKCAKLFNVDNIIFRAEINLGGCSDFQELSINEMFGINSDYKQRIIKNGFKTEV